MLDTYFFLLLVLFFVASFMRDDFALTLLYLILGTFAAGMWWSRRALGQVKHEREFIDHAFVGEKINVRLRVENAGWLPLPWMELREALPVELGGSRPFQRVTQLPGREKVRFEYTLEALKRGYYQLGPLTCSTGDILGLSGTVAAEGLIQHVTVYPKIVLLKRVQIPSRSPHGTLRHTRPMFEDPTRVFGKREYTVGDSLRRVDWKASATTGQLQVKLFEPSIALETLVVLNLSSQDYGARSRIDDTELAVVIAASLANWIVEQKQTVGLLVNGRDPLSADGAPQYFSPRKGQAHLMRLLESLARAEMTENVPLPLPDLLQRQRYLLPWGTTLIVITGSANDALLDELYQARRAGQNALLVLAGRGIPANDIARRAGIFGIPVVPIAYEHDLDIWRK
jgi:uncharacterized protein (DUF58 family)